MAAELLVDETGPDLLRVVGEIDTHTAPTLAERLADIPAHAALGIDPVSYTHLRAHETDSYLVCRLLLEKKK